MSKSTTARRESRSKTTTRADQLRPLNLPQLVTVELDEAGLPTTIANSVRLSACPPVRPDNAAEQGAASANNTAERAVESILEIWHIDDEWWREPISRRYVEVILKGGKHVVLYEDLASKDWFMQMP